MQLYDNEWAALTLKTLKYSGEHNGKFETHCNIIVTAYNTHASLNQHYLDDVKVKQLHDSIQVADNTEVQMAKALMLEQYKHNFTGACIYITMRMCEIFPRNSNSSTPSRTVSQINHVSTTVNGRYLPDIFNIHDDVWHRLGRFYQKKIKRIRKEYGRGGRNRCRRGGAHVGRKGRNHQYQNNNDDEGNRVDRNQQNRSLPHGRPSERGRQDGRNPKREPYLLKTMLHVNPSTPHNTTLTPSAAQMLVRRHIDQCNDTSIRVRVTFTDLHDRGLFFFLQNIYIRPVHINFTRKNGRGEPTLLTDGRYTSFEQFGWTPILEYINNYPYEAASRLIYNWTNGDRKCHKLRRIFLDPHKAQPVPQWGRNRDPTRFLRDTRFLSDTISTIDGLWATFHDEFPFGEMADFFLQKDWHAFVLSTELYNAMHEFYYGHRQNAWERLDRLVPCKGLVKMLES